MTKKRLKVRKTIVLVGLMGSGKSCIGRMLGTSLGLAFVDADAEIEAAAGCSIKEVFERFGEDAFRNGERKVISRLLDDPVHVLATGGGAFMDETVRAKIVEKGISIWLRADINLLWSRVSRRRDRPLLNRDHPREILESLMEERYPVYASADITVDSACESPELTVDRTLDVLARYIETHRAEQPAS